MDESSGSVNRRLTSVRPRILNVTANIDELSDNALIFSLSTFCSLKLHFISVIKYHAFKRTFCSVLFTHNHFFSSVVTTKLTTN